jgi:esterase/lipase
MNPQTFTSHPSPVNSYAEAVARIEALQAKDPPDINPLCCCQFMTHGLKVEKVILFLHGYTNCPEQFRTLGEMFYNLGYNVFIPCFPHHGLQDRLSKHHAHLQAEELATLTDEVVDIAHGLGSHITLAGLSCGGVMTGWAAQHRADLDEAVLISPAFGLHVIPSPLTSSAMFLAMRLPNSFRWWDVKAKADLAPEHAYPWFSTRGLAQVLRLGQAVLEAARRSKPAARSIIVITNANDFAVSNRVTAELVRRWRKQGADQLHTYEFAAELKLGHDLIDPGQSDQRTDVVYPKLVELVTT